MGKKLAIAVALLIPAALLLRYAWGLKKPLYTAPEVPVAELLATLEPTVRFEPRQIPVVRNSWPTLLEAAQSVRRPTFPETQVMDIALLDPGRLKSLGTFVSLQEVLRRNRTAMELARRAVALPDCSAAEIEGGDNPVPALRGLQSLVTMLGRRGTALLHEGNVDQGIDDLIAAHRVGEKILASGGPSYYSGLGSTMLARAAREIRIAALNPKMTDAGLKRILRSLPDSNRLRQDFKDSLRSDLYWLVRNEFARLKGPGWNSLPGLSRREAYRDYDSGWQEVDTIASVVLEGHEKPFDRRNTVERLSPIYRQLIENVDRPWASQLPVIEAIVGLVDDWPRSVLSGAELGSKAVQAEIEDRRPRILQSTNPYGRLAAWYFIHISDQSQMAPFRNRADLEATRLIAALRIFEIQNGKLPNRLAELSESGILERLPDDPFGNGGFRYDPKRRLLWSVGPNQVDDGATERTFNSIQSKDMVWTLQLGKPVVLPPAEEVQAELGRRRDMRIGPMSDLRRPMARPVH